MTEGWVFGIVFHRFWAVESSFLSLKGRLENRRLGNRQRNLTWEPIELLDSQNI